MKLTKSLLIVPVACGILWAQAPANQPKPAPKPVTPAAKNGPAPAKPAAAPASKPAPTAQKSATPAVKPAPVTRTAAKPVPAPPAHPTHAKPVARTAPMATPFSKRAPKPEGEVKPAAVKETATATRVTSGKMRDPFVSPVVRTGNIGSGCETGKRCLVVDQIVLKGIVKSGSGFIAVVENPAKRAYFMRENDPVFNGKVIKITGDTVVFQEQVLDKLGKQSMREVVKKVNAPIV